MKYKFVISSNDKQSGANNDGYYNVGVNLPQSKTGRWILRNNSFSIDTGGTNEMSSASGRLSVQQFTQPYYWSSDGINGYVCEWGNGQALAADADIVQNLNPSPVTINQPSTMLWNIQLWGAEGSKLITASGSDTEIWSWSFTLEEEEPNMN